MVGLECQVNQAGLAQLQKRVDLRLAKNREDSDCQTGEKFLLEQKRSSFFLADGKNLKTFLTEPPEGKALTFDGYLSNDTAIEQRRKAVKEWLAPCDDAEIEIILMHCHSETAMENGNTITDELFPDFLSYFLIDAQKIGRDVRIFQRTKGELKESIFRVEYIFPIKFQDCEEYAFELNVVREYQLTDNGLKLILHTANHDLFDRLAECTNLAEKVRLRFLILKNAVLNFQNKFRFDESLLTDQNFLTHQSGVLALIRYIKNNPGSAYDLSGCDLSGCDLSRCNLSGCNLSGCNLSNCDFTEMIIDESTNFSDATGIDKFIAIFKEQYGDIRGHKNFIKKLEYKNAETYGEKLKSGENLKIVLLHAKENPFLTSETKNRTARALNQTHYYFAKTRILEAAAHAKNRSLTAAEIAKLKSYGLQDSSLEVATTQPSTLVLLDDQIKKINSLMKASSNDGAAFHDEQLGLSTSSFVGDVSRPGFFATDAAGKTTSFFDYLDLKKNPTLEKFKISSPEDQKKTCNTWLCETLGISNEEAEKHIATHNQMLTSLADTILSNIRNYAMNSLFINGIGINFSEVDTEYKKVNGETRLVKTYRPSLVEIQTYDVLGELGAFTCTFKLNDETPPEYVLESANCDNPLLLSLITGKNAPTVDRYPNVIYEVIKNGIAQSNRSLQKKLDKLCEIARKLDVPLDLSNVDLTGVKFEGKKLSKCINLAGATLTDATFTDISFDEVIVDAKTKFANVEFKNVTCDENKNFTYIIGDSKLIVSQKEIYGSLDLSAGVKLLLALQKASEDETVRTELHQEFYNARKVQVQRLISNEPYFPKRRAYVGELLQLSKDLKVPVDLSGVSSSLKRAYYNARKTQIQALLGFTPDFKKHEYVEELLKLADDLKLPLSKNFSSLTLRGVIFDQLDKKDLRNVSFENSDLRRANFNGCTIDEKTNLRGANLSGVCSQGLKYEYLFGGVKSAIPSEVFVEIFIKLHKYDKANSYSPSLWTSGFMNQLKDNISSDQKLLMILKHAQENKDSRTAKILKKIKGDAEKALKRTQLIDPGTFKVPDGSKKNMIEKFIDAVCVQYSNNKKSPFNSSPMIRVLRALKSDKTFLASIETANNHQAFLKLMQELFLAETALLNEQLTEKGVTDKSERDSYLFVSLKNIFCEQCETYKTEHKTTVHAFSTAMRVVPFEFNHASELIDGLNKHFSKFVPPISELFKKLTGLLDQKDFLIKMMTRETDEEVAFTLLNTLFPKRSEQYNTEAELFASLQADFNHALTNDGKFNDAFLRATSNGLQGAVPDHMSQNEFPFESIVYALTGNLKRPNSEVASSNHSITTVDLEEEGLESSQSSDEQRPEENTLTEEKSPDDDEQKALIVKWNKDQMEENPKPDPIFDSVTVAALTGPQSPALFGGAETSKHDHKTQPKKNESPEENDNSASTITPTTPSSWP